METQELVEALVAGKKMTLRGCNDDRYWCEYNPEYLLKYQTPFRYRDINGTNTPMDGVWLETDWVEVKKSKWRLPTVKELVSIINYDKEYPATDEGGFQSVTYWTSNEKSGEDDLACVVDLQYGGVYYMNKNNFVTTRYVLNNSEELVWSETFEDMTWDEAMHYAKNNDDNTN